MSENENQSSGNIFAKIFELLVLFVLNFYQFILATVAVSLFIIFVLGVPAKEVIESVIAMCFIVSIIYLMTDRDTIDEVLGIKKTPKKLGDPQ